MRNKVYPYVFLLIYVFSLFPSLISYKHNDCCDVTRTLSCNFISSQENTSIINYFTHKELSDDYCYLCSVSFINDCHTFLNLSLKSCSYFFEYLSSIQTSFITETIRFYLNKSPPINYFNLYLS